MHDNLAASGAQHVCDTAISSCSSRPDTTTPTTSTTTTNNSNTNTIMITIIIIDDNDDNDTALRGEAPQHEDKALEQETSR